MSLVETAVAERAPTLTLPRKRERGRTDFGVSPIPSIRRGEPPLPLAGEGWGVAGKTLASARQALSVPSPLVGEGQGGG